jgi:hypothetical protein
MSQDQSPTQLKFDPVKKGNSMNAKTSQLSYITTHHENISKRSLQKKVFYRIMNHPHRTEPYVFVCLPGKKCWEIEYLWRFNCKTYKGIGPGIKKIIALEKDVETFEMIKQKYKDSDFVEVINTTTTEFLYTYQNKVDLIYFDYYSNFNGKVKQDIEIMFERKILNEKGKFIINFLGARESISDQILHQRLFKELMELGEFDLQWEDINEDQKRCIAFNGLIARYRAKSTTNKTYDTNNANYVNTTAPIWFRYRTHTGHSMLTGYFTLNAYKSRQSRQAVKRAKQVWTVSEQWGITDWTKEVSKSRDRKDYRILVIDQVKKFYEENHYTPSCIDLGRSAITYLKEAIKLLELLPRTHRTVDDIKKEIDRIYQRDKVIHYYNICKAKIATKNHDTVMTIKHIISYCEQNNYCHRLNLHSIRIKINHLNMINRYIDHLQAGKAAAAYQQYGSIRRILNSNVSFQNAYNKKIELQNKMIDFGLTKDGEMKIHYSDQQLIDMFFNKDINLHALGSLRLMSQNEMTKYLQELGVDTSSKYERRRKKLAPKIIADFKKSKSVSMTSLAVKYKTNTKYVIKILKDKGLI